MIFIQSFCTKTYTISFVETIVCSIVFKPKFKYIKCIKQMAITVSNYISIVGDRDVDREG